MDLLVSSLASDELDRLTQAQELVRGFCHWHIAPSRTETVTIDGSGSPFLMLPSLYVTDVASVTEDGTLLDATTYEWSASGQVWRSWPWSGHFRGIAVEFTHGYEVVPPEVAGIIKAVAQRATDNPGSRLRQQAGPFAMQYATDGSTSALLDSEKTALERYRLPGRP